MSTEGSGRLNPQPLNPPEETAARMLELILGSISEFQVSGATCFQGLGLRV